MVQLEGLSARLLIYRYLWHHRNIVGSPQGSSLVTVTAFRIRHLLLLSVQGVLPQTGVVLHQFQPCLCVSLVLCCRVIIFAVFRANDTNDFTSFALFRHDCLRPQSSERTIKYDSTATSRSSDSAYIGKLTSNRNSCGALPSAHGPGSATGVGPEDTPTNKVQLDVFSTLTDRRADHADAARTTYNPI